MLLTPAYRVTIGQKVVDTTHEPKASTVVDLAVRLDLDTPADSFECILGPVDGLKPARDDNAEIQLGYADNGGLTKVLTGKVVTVEPALTAVRVTGYTPAETLLRSFLDQTYESKTAGQIVSDLAGRAKVDVESAEDGINFPAYVIDGRRSFYRHMLDLAALCGFDLYFNPDGKLVFEKFITGKTVHVFEYAKHIVALQVERTPPEAGRVEAWGESPSGRQGDDAWAWLTKDFSNSKGAAGSGDPLLLLERPALRTSNAAQTAADAASTRLQRRTVGGRVLTIGRPQVMLGDAIGLLGLPDSSLNTNFQVRSVTHRITKRDGFTTAVGFQAISVNGGVTPVL
jgi:phage protein D